MATTKKQYYGIKFPFTCNNLDKFFLDLNSTYKDKLLSDILHVLLTRKGTRMKNPEFGTSLTSFIFELNDEKTWENVESEAIKAVNKYVPDVNLKSITVSTPEDDSDDTDNTIYLDLRYEYNGENNRAVVKI